MLCEGLKQNATIVIAPGTAVETMQLGPGPIRHGNLTGSEEKEN